MSSIIMNPSIWELSSDVLFDKLKWMTAKEAAFYLRVSVGQIRNMVYRDQLRSYRVNNRLRFLRSDLDQVVKPSIQEASYG